MTIFLSEPHDNFGIIRDWCHHPHSTDKAGRNYDFARSHSQSRFYSGFCLPVWSVSRTHEASIQGIGKASSAGSGRWPTAWKVDPRGHSQPGHRTRPSAVGQVQWQGLDQTCSVSAGIHSAQKCRLISN